MFKILILISCAFLPLSQALAKVEVRWFTVASLVLEDEETKIFFDPMFTRAGIQHWLNISDLRSDETLVASVIKEHKLEKVNALFASHSHYDHVIDAPIVSKLTGATFYVDGSSEIVDVTEPINIEIEGRGTSDDPLVLGNEVLIGQTVLEKTDLLVDCTNRRLIANPAHPDQPVLKVK